MKTNTQRKLLLASVASLLVGGLMISATGCQLIADFDRSLIEAGSDASDATTDGTTPKPDATTPDTGAGDSATDSATDGGDADAAGDADADA
jgi:hypothetical protein